MKQPLGAGFVVFGVTGVAVVGPLLGLSPAWIALAAGFGLAALTVDAARFGGRGGHLLAEALPGGEARLRRIAVHEAGHVLVAGHEQMPVAQVLVGSLACLQAGLQSNGCTQLEPPAHAKLAPAELRRWSRVLQAGMVAEQLVYGESLGGADDRALLGRLWGLSGKDAQMAQLEQRRARREVEQWLGQRQAELESEAELLLQMAPRLVRSQPAAMPASQPPELER
ncbi:hypothetical protein [Cyanobium sp. WAJ14-Wanaka]|uniref:hypothetical protein n=1 Tax=Cyanobium sp. WAJ14-Wanaka TaxID=2823725 RepID=UPI0020CCC294|nr:hypothetical protein [Cyanobium sp. WAJ14-Wanaka]MCP9775016.1 hypothetical protein [Cyanobium sp. WAJ14-Wanaka]